MVQKIKISSLRAEIWYLEYFEYVKFDDDVNFFCSKNPDWSHSSLLAQTCIQWLFLLVISNSSWQHCLVLRDTVVVCSYVNYVFLRKDFRPKYFKFYWPGSYPFLLLNGQMKLKNSKLFWYSLSSNFQNNANTFRTDPDPNRTVMLEQRCSNVIS